MYYYCIITTNLYYQIKGKSDNFVQYMLEMWHSLRMCTDEVQTQGTDRQ